MSLSPTHPPVGQRHKPITCPFCGRWADGQMLPCRCDVARMLDAVQARERHAVTLLRNVLASLGTSVHGTDLNQIALALADITDNGPYLDTIRVRVVPKPDRAPVPLHALDDDHEVDADCEPADVAAVS